ncbi:MAG: hypothetical protein RR139_05100 [Lachnospiraceae bacterium]
MLNYIKSECYRIFHGKEFYCLFAILTALITAMNVITYWFGKLPGFTYANTRFVYSTIDTSMHTFIYIIIVICSVMDGSSMHNLKNSAASGISRKTIYIGRLITQSIICIGMYVILMGFYFLLGKLLMENSGIIAAENFIRSAWVCIPMFLGVIAVYQCCVFLNKNTVSAMVIFITVLVAVPALLRMLGMKFIGIKRVSDLLIYNLLRVEFVETAAGYQRNYTWDTTEGIWKCIMIGIITVVLFTMIGIKYFQKKEIR